MHFALAFSQTLEQSGTSISYFQLLARRMKVRKRRRPTVGKKVGKAFVDQMASLPRIPSQWGKVDQEVASQHVQHHHHQSIWPNRKNRSQNKTPHLRVTKNWYHLCKEDIKMSYHFTPDFINVLWEIQKLATGHLTEH